MPRERDFGRLEEVVARALAKAPDARFQSAEEFSQALAEATRPTTAPVPLVAAADANATVSLDAEADADALPIAQAAPPRSGRRVPVIVASVIAAAVVAVVVGVEVTSHPDAREQEPAMAVAPPPAAPAAPVAPVTPPAVAPESPPQQQPPPPPPAAPDDPVADVVAHAQQLATAGRREAAITALQHARTAFPKDARLPYEIAKLYLDKLFVPDGLKNARAAFALDPAYKSDPDLIKAALKCFNATATTDWVLAAFLHDEIGAAAKPYLAETAASHPNPIVRARAAAELKRYR